MAQGRSQQSGGRGRRKPAFRRKKKNKLGTALVIVTVLAVSVVLIYGYTNLMERRAELKERAETLQNQINTEEQRTQDLQNYETYTHTKRFAEETAKEVLGYVYDGEIVFKIDE